MCDAAASHIKRAIYEQLNVNKEVPKKSTDMFSAINGVNNHFAHEIKNVDKNIPQFKTFNGIRSFHKFKFDRIVYAYKTSDSVNFDQIYDPIPVNDVN